MAVDPSEKGLIGASGGMDSMVLLAALHELGYNVAAAHVNFQLRGDDSDGDAALVRDWCKNHQVEYVEKVIDTKEYASTHQLNIQSAAREIRYAWWQDLVDEGRFQWIATAHHHDDNIETFLLNLLRGTGMKGLKGIPLKRDYFIRPMIDISGSVIESFASSFNIPFRKDKSNDSDDYMRNKIRHHLLPLLEDLKGDFNKVMKHNLLRLDSEWEAWEASYHQWEFRNVHQASEGFRIYYERPLKSFLLRWLEEKGIPWKLAFDFISSESDNGNVLEHGTFCLSRAKEGFYFQQIEEDLSVWIPGPGTYVIDGDELSIEPVKDSDFSFTSDPWTEYADLSLVPWPLEFRQARDGDHFQPIGMKGRSKKLQDYLVDLKLDFLKKTNPYPGIRGSYGMADW